MGFARVLDCRNLVFCAVAHDDSAHVFDNHFYADGDNHHAHYDADDCVHRIVNPCRNRKRDEACCGYAHIEETVEHKRTHRLRANLFVCEHIRKTDAEFYRQTNTDKHNALPAVINGFGHSHTIERADEEQSAHNDRYDSDDKAR